MGLSFLGAQPPGVPNPTLSPRLLAEKRQELLDQANKLRTGLFKIDETREKVEVMSLELEDAKKKVAEFQKQQGSSQKSVAPVDKAPFNMECSLLWTCTIYYLV